MTFEQTWRLRIYIINIAERCMLWESEIDDEFFVCDVCIFSKRNNHFAIMRSRLRKNVHNSWFVKIHFRVHQGNEGRGRTPCSNFWIMSS